MLKCISSVSNSSFSIFIASVWKCYTIIHFRPMNKVPAHPQVWWVKIFFITLSIGRSSSNPILNFHHNSSSFSSLFSQSFKTKSLVLYMVWGANTFKSADRIFTLPPKLIHFQLSSFGFLEHRDILESLLALSLIGASGTSRKLAAELSGSDAGVRVSDCDRSRLISGASTAELA